MSSSIGTFTKYAVKALTVLLLTLSAATTFATNGYFSHGYGTPSKGVAGAGTALAVDPMIVASNPAGLVFVGTQFEMGGAFFNAERSYRHVGSLVFPKPAYKEINSDKEWYLIPTMALSYQLDDKSAVGFAMYGNGGMNTTYRAKSLIQAGSPTVGTFGDSEGGVAVDTGVDMMQVFMSGTYARKVTDKLSLGGSLLYSWQRFSAHGFGAFAPFVYDKTCTAASNSCITNMGNDYGYGFGYRVGALYDVTPKLSVGASYQSKLNMTKFQRYKNLFARGGEFDIPSNYNFGVSYKINSRHTVVFDFQHINFNEVPSVGNTMDGNGQMTGLAADCGGAAKDWCLGGPDGLGFGWSDMQIFKLGYVWQYSKNLALRFGYSQTDQPISDENVMFNVVAPAVIEEHYTMGGTWKHSKDVDINFAMLYAPNNTVIGDAPPEYVGFAPQTEGSVQLSMDQFEIEMSFSWKF